MGIKMKKHKKLKIVLIVFTILLVYCLGSFYASRYFLSTTTYEYESEKINESINIVVLTDEHANAFGKDNQKLINYIKKEAPDLIAIVGDVLNFYSEDSHFLIDIITKLHDISPVYYSPGNHEVEYLAVKGIEDNEFRGLVENAGGVYLDQDYVDIKIKNQPIRIGGIYDYVFNNLNLPQEQYIEKKSYKFLQGYEKTNSFKLMLTHRPESYITNADDAKWSIDLALCGHEHGGQIQLPFIGGFYSTHFGLFPKYIDGFHMMNGIPVVISRGLGTYYSNKTPPRFNNIPEIVKISLS